MNAYRPPAYRPGYRPGTAPRLGQETPTGAQIKAAGVGLGLVSTTLSAAAAWVGINAGLKESGLLQIAGWVVGLTGGLMGAMSFFGTVGLIMTPSEEIERAAQEAQQPPLRAMAQSPQRGMRTA